MGERKEIFSSQYTMLSLLADGRVWLVLRPCTGHRKIVMSHSGAGLVGELRGDLDHGKYGVGHSPL